MLALRDKNRPAIRGINNGVYKSSTSNDDDDDYKEIENFKKVLIDEHILDKNGAKEFDNIINKWVQTKDKDIVYISPKGPSTRRVEITKFDIYNIFSNYLKKDINYKDIEEIKNNIKEAVNLYQEDRLKYSDKSKRIISNSNKVIKAIELSEPYIINRQ